MAVQRRSGSAEISAHTAPVLPTSFACPPMTTISILPQGSATAEAGEVAQVLLQQAGPPAPQDLAGPANRLVAQDAGPSAQDYAGANVGMLSQAHLAAENSPVIADAGAAN